MAIKVHPSLFVHPGEWLRTEMIEPRNLTVRAAAERLGVTRQALSALLNGRAGLSPEMAIRFEKLFGLGADTLIRMQANHDLRIARARADEIKVEPYAARGSPMSAPVS